MKTETRYAGHLLETLLGVGRFLPDAAISPELHERHRKLVVDAKLLFEGILSARGDSESLRDVKELHDALFTLEGDAGDSGRPRE